MTGPQQPLDLSAVAHEDVSGDPIAPSPDTASAAAPAAESPADAPGARPAPGWLTGRPRKPEGTTARRPRPDRPPRTAKPRKDSPALKKAVMELYTSAGMMVLPFDQQCGTVVVNSAEQCADAMIKLAEENDAVMRALQALVQTSAWGGVVAAHLPIIMAVTAHHFAPVRDRLPDNVVPMTNTNGAPH